MRNKIALALTIAVIFSSIIHGQVGLRRAYDFDGDGKADRTLFRASSNVWWVSKSSGGVNAFQHGIAAISTIAPGDYDGDGKADLAVWQAVNGTFWYIRSRDSVPVNVSFGMAGDEPVAQDYDGDGKTDCAIVRRVNGQLQWWIFRSSISDPAFATIVYSYGIASDSPVAGDYDGDGRYDLAVQSQVGNNLDFHVFCPTSQINFSIQWGYKTDISVPADYDGDGITDIAICRFIDDEDLAEWWIQNSSDYSVNVFRFGTFTESFHDIPIPADYDGDGYADLAVWRNMSPVAKFYIRKTSDNQDLILDFGVFGDIPIGSHTVR